MQKLLYVANSAEFFLRLFATKIKFAHIYYDTNIADIKLMLYNKNILYVP